MHVNMMAVSSPIVNMKYFLGSILPSGFMMDAEKEKTLYPISKFMSTIVRESGYFHIQATKPDTIGENRNTNSKKLSKF